MKRTVESLFDVMVCTCDAYEDTWVPFFTLIFRHWPGVDRLRFILTTERKNFSFDGLNITCSRTDRGSRGKSKPWGLRVRSSLDLVEAPLVLTMLDDFFVKRTVRVIELERFASAMVEQESWGRLELNPQGVRRGVPWSTDSRLVIIDPAEEYRVNTQTALWKVACLHEILKPHENAWEFEARGTVRAQDAPWLFIRLANGWDGGKDTSLIHGITDDGIRRGRWRREVVELLFAEHGIDVNYCQRGFYEPTPSEESPSSSTGIRRLLRKDLLWAVLRRVQHWWSMFRSFH